jgi:hypothetical protein
MSVFMNYHTEVYTIVKQFYSANRISNRFVEAVEL